MSNKTCTKCHVSKPEDEFALNKKGKLGREAACRSCKSDNDRERRSDPDIRAQQNEYSRQYQLAHPQEYRRTTRNAFHRKRVRDAGGFVDETLDVFAVFEEDNYICQICGEDIDPFLRNKHPRMVSLDHIIPVSQGGSHTRDNVQTAPLGCNVRKFHSLSRSYS